ncbi:YlaI family protein [Listeria grayi]|uniref:YlaI family protein n=1 Tax=Listeria grayi TaxID=1641 RepID=UPI00162A8DEF|nr:YlaI family protein [Listeria grayi]MBC1921021.1 YlaI family protein [Listeria grayi]
MKVTCILCDQTHEIDSRTFKAKRLRNKPIKMYLCEECDHRIAVNTVHRINSGKFDFHKPYKKPFIDFHPQK